LEVRLPLERWKALLIVLVGLAGCTGPNPAYLTDGADGGAGRDAGLDRTAPDQAAADQAIADQTVADQTQVLDRFSDPAPGEGSPPPGDLRTGLVGYWKMNDPPGSLAATDSVAGPAQRAVLEGLDPGTAWVSMGRFESALEMPRDNRAYGLRVEANPTIDGLYHYTLAAWILRTQLQPTSYQFIISRQVGDTDYEAFGLLVYRDRLRAFAPHSEPFTAADVLAPTDLPVGTWIHVAVTYDGQTLTLYQDAAVVDTLVQPLTALARTAKPLYIGTNQNAGQAEPFVGVLDEVLLYSVALGPSQIQALRAGVRP
jgi:hypothetical protein